MSDAPCLIAFSRITLHSFTTGASSDARSRSSTFSASPSLFAKSTSSSMSPSISSKLNEDSSWDAS